ncbi:hypothetical protein BDV96DRAFT_54710 [Lophiotrema nucula]|uniref:Zn(2)-C6 fungal-type domain-containing protein n=1 Tax=Lophiotrema nucula TaxID=690887 RepID=A0A6A5Z8U0_9PLEO|nr:hypothetical protein BDV96DRAFT_54710 [Lophiotrema nucula]
MFMILPTAKEPQMSRPSQDSQEPPRTRVKKACNRCRIKKSKCNGQIPCARCERDQIACRADLGSVKVHELSRSYISSLEAQQLSLLDALRELYHRVPHNGAIQDTIKRLQARGFDVGPLETMDATLPNIESTRKQEDFESTADSFSWDNTDSNLESLERLLAQPATPQMVSDFLWNFSDLPAEENPQEPLQQNPLQSPYLEYSSNNHQDALFNTAFLGDGTLMDTSFEDTIQFPPSAPTSYDIGKA